MVMNGCRIQQPPARARTRTARARALAACAAADGAHLARVPAKLRGRNAVTTAPGARDKFCSGSRCHLSSCTPSPRLHAGATGARPGGIVNLGLDGNATKTDARKNVTVTSGNSSTENNHTKPFKMDLKPKQIADLLKVCEWMRGATEIVVVWRQVVIEADGRRPGAAQQ